MRKPRDFGVELQTLERKAKQLKERRVRQLGELVGATGADALDVELLAGVLLDAVSMKDATTKEGWRQRGAAFLRGRLFLAAGLARSRKAERSARAAARRLEAARARSDTREWVVNRRERTRHLIELGGLVAKAGLVNLTGDDRAVLYGALLSLADRVREQPEDAMVL